MSNGINIVNESSGKESSTEALTKPRYSPISEHSSVTGTPQAIREWLMLSQRDFHVNPLASPERDEGTQTEETCGRQLSSAFALYDHDSHSWKTCQVCLLTNTPDEFSETWPKAGTMLDGVCYPQPNWEHRISVIDSGLWPSPRAGNPGSRPNGKGGKILAEEVKKSLMYPTPRAEDSQSCGAHRGQPDTLTAFVKLWPTPAARDYRNQHADGSDAFKKRQEHPRGVNLVEEMQRMGHIGQLNPTWVEWLMGWPLGWTDLKPLEMDKFRQWCEQHGRF